MKKTVTTILSLALALILVTSLGSGVSSAYGKEDRDREVVILDCIGTFLAPFIQVDAYDSFPAISADNLPDFPPSLASGASCAETVAFLLNNKFKMEDVTQATVGFVQATIRYTFVKK